MSLLKTLQMARELLSSSDKWVQGKFADGDRMCLVRALGSSGLFYGRAIEAVREAAGLSREWKQGLTLSQWNDEKTRTHAEILVALDKAIATEKAKAGKS